MIRYFAFLSIRFFVFFSLVAGVAAETYDTRPWLRSGTQAPSGIVYGWAPQSPLNLDVPTTPVQLRL